MNESDKHINKTLKTIESVMIGNAAWKKINEERSPRNKSARVYFDDFEHATTSIKLEIGSSVRPEPYGRKQLKSMIGDYLSTNDMEDVMDEYGLESFELNVLDITRTFIDKLMAVKRHAISGSLPQKARHLYDIVKLYHRRDIQSLLKDETKLKSIVRLTKKTDEAYLEKRQLPKNVNPLEPYRFDTWMDYLDKTVKDNYEALHQSLLYTDEPQNWQEVLDVLNAIDARLHAIGE